MSIFRELGIHGGKNRVNEEVVYNIAKIYTIMDRSISLGLAQYNLSSAKFNILMVVKHVGKEKGIAQNGISQRLLVTTSNITRMLDKLENDGLVSRMQVKGDRRVKRIRITSKGSDLLDKAWLPYKQTVDCLVDGCLTSAEKFKMNVCLREYLSNIKEA